ncbi:hypothetical protein C8A05DRAFT_38968 [Staphylotrichum tortipilum]|uniref:HNH nuclease domain-containing protein n=1 Tax=Staphylotrichum tortipilum TaxID=2831512 RepID=A0AAN6MCG1_9PEZI|nr:hypothetical protein C8A05DRAFT_38968 [Staphylotrichum longicolle]
MALSVDGETDLDLENNEDALGSDLSRFADYLFNNFFFPLRASSAKTPQLTPLTHSAIQQAQGGGVQAFAGTTDRVDGDQARDDDGNPLFSDPRFSSLEVAHILPHSLTATDKGSLLPPSKAAALDILNMFDNGVIHLIEGDDIDRPQNAITLTYDLHLDFGNFDIFFEALPDQPHTYRICSFLHPVILPGFPVTRTLYLSEDRTIEPPLPRLLALHRAIAHILHLSAAGDYIAKILRDPEWKDTKADGSTELGRLVTLRLGGWMEGISS